MSAGTKPQGASRPQDETPARVVLQRRNLAIQLCVTLKTARIHDVGNIAFQGPLSNFIETVGQMWTAEGDFKLQAVGDFETSQGRVSSVSANTWFVGLGLTLN